MYSTILTFIRFNNFDTQHLNGPRHLFHSFCCTTRRVFEPLRVYEPSFNTDKYGVYIYICMHVCVCVCVCVCVYMCAHMCVYVCMCVCACMCMCVLYACVYVCVCVCMRVCTPTCDYNIANYIIRGISNGFGWHLPRIFSYLTYLHLVSIILRLKSSKQKVWGYTALIQKLYDFQVEKHKICMLQLAIASQFL